MGHGGRRKGAGRKQDPDIDRESLNAYLHQVHHPADGSEPDSAWEAARRVACAQLDIDLNDHAAQDSRLFRSKREAVRQNAARRTKRWAEDVREKTLVPLPDGSHAQVLTVRHAGYALPETRAKRPDVCARCRDDFLPHFHCEACRRPVPLIQGPLDGGIDDRYQRAEGPLWVCSRECYDAAAAAPRP